MSLLKLKTRQKTIGSLNSIFSALQVVTVVRTQKTKEKYFALDRYLNPLRTVLRGRIKKQETERKILIVVTSNRGLCGSFNAQVASQALKYLRGEQDFSVIVLGKSGAEYIRKRGQKISLTDFEAVEKPTFEKTAELFKKLYEAEAEIHVAYNTYKSALIQTPTIVELTPLPSEFKKTVRKQEFILEPTPQKTLKQLFYHYLEVRFFQIILESQMGELGARFMVLKGAVDTSKELSDKLVLQINKTRQAGITRDLLEIVSAAEALRKDEE